MLRRLFIPITAVVLSQVVLLAAEPNDAITTVDAKPNAIEVHSEDLHPFTHFASVPAGADLGSIRFEKVRLVRVPTKIRYRMDLKYCKEAASRDSGGSVFCPSVSAEASEPAYEVTFSLTGEPLTSDEYAGRYFTFSVFFRPDELAGDAQQAFSRRKLSRSDAAAYFAVSTRRATTNRMAFDNERSHFCKGNFVDGAWTYADPGCKDEISYKMVTLPSDNITIQVEPVSPGRKGTQIVSAK